MAKLHYHESPTPAQKSSFSSYLSEDEELILVTGLGKAYRRSKFVIYMAFPGMLFFAIFIGASYLFGFDKLVCYILGLASMVGVAVLKSLHLYHSNRYLLTTRRVIVKKGLFSTKLYAALYDKITHLEVIQTFTDRFLLHHGTIIVNTAGSSNNEIVLKYIDYPLELKNLLERLINREREQFGHGGMSSTVEGEILS